MFSSRVKQGLLFLFGRYRSEWEVEIKSILDEKEFSVFMDMSRYDKIHSYYIYKKVKESKILKDKIEYHKLALLHDCGKENIGLLRRVKKVLVGDKLLSNHALLGKEKLKNINSVVGNLVYNHHNLNYDIYMSEFQRIDDE